MIREAFCLLTVFAKRNVSKVSRNGNVSRNVWEASLGGGRKARLLIQTYNNKTLPSLSLFDLKKCSYLTGSGSVCPEHGAGSTGSFPQGGAGRAAGSYPRSQGCGAVLFSNLSFKMSKPPELRRKARKN